MNYILLGFLVFCWNLKGFKAVVNSIGKLILIEDEHLMGFERKELHVLVEINFEERLPEELEVVWEGGTFM